MGQAMTIDPSKVVVVPVDVVAFCVGAIDAQEATAKFAGASTVYTDPATPDTPAFRGSNVTRGFDDAPAHQMEQGVHLHWAMPDALTRATVPEDGPVEFPTVPNHWLVSRLVITGTTPM